MTRYLAITTCNAEQWEKYGRAMAKTFCRHWPRDVPLRIYAEGFSFIGLGGVEIESLDLAAPWLAPWKAARSQKERGILSPPVRGKRGIDRHYTYRTDAVKFSHKVAAIGAAACEDVDVLIWMDADIVTHSPVTAEWLKGLFPEPADIAWLDRANKYPECGFMMFRLPSARTVISEIVETYVTGVIFRYVETHDSYVIQQIVEAACRRGEIVLASLSGDARNCGHPAAAGPLGACLDHLKGNRKRNGRSHHSDLMGPRPEPHWQ